MRRFGGYQAGSAMLVDRAALIEALERIAADPRVAAERQRKARLSAELDKAARCHVAAQVKIPVPADVHCFRICDLPDGIQLQAGQLTVAFADAEQLLASLYELARAAMNDYDAFRETAEAHRTPG